MLGDCRLITRSVAPVPSSTYSTFCQLLPPFVMRYTPRSSLRENRWPMAATQTVSGFFG